MDATHADYDPARVLLYFNLDRTRLIGVEPPELSEFYYQRGCYLITPQGIQVLPSLHLVEPVVVKSEI
jgi:hypothetical protein